MIPVDEMAVDGDAQAIRAETASRGAGGLPRKARAGCWRLSRRIPRRDRPDRRGWRNRAVEPSWLHPARFYGSLAALLFNQPHIGNDDFVAERLAHVVDGQRGDARAGQGFHLDAGLVRDRDFAADHSSVAEMNSISKRQFSIGNG